MVAVFVGDLHPEVSDLMLLNKFNNAGPIQSVHVCKDQETGTPLGYAYVNFYHRADAERAIKMFNFELLMKRPMRVMWSRWEPTSKMIDGCNIVVKNLDPSIDDASLFYTFSVFGRIVSCKVVESKGFGYIQFEAPEAAALTFNRFNGMLLKGRQVTVEYFKSREERKAEDQDQGNNLYIKNLDDNIDNDCLYRTFAQFGTIKSAKVMMENGRSKGFGFVCFTSSQDAMKAMNEMNGMMWGKKKIYVGLAQKKEKRQALLQRMFRKEFSSPAVKTPCSEDQTVETDAPVDTVEGVDTSSPVGTVEGVEAAAPVDTVEGVATAAPVDTVEGVATAAPVDTVEGVATAAPVDTVEGVATAAPVDTVEGVATAAPVDTVEGVATAAPVDTVEGVATAAPVDTVEGVATAAPVDTVEGVATAAPVDTVEGVATAAPVDTVEGVATAAPVDTVEGVDTSAPAAPVDTVEGVATAAPVETEEGVVTSTPVDTVEGVVTSTPVDTVEGVVTSTPVDTVEKSPATLEETLKIKHRNS